MGKTSIGRSIADALGRPATTLRAEELTSRGLALLALEAIGAIERPGDLPVFFDRDRFALMGHSMGGGGTWHIGLKYPKIWAGLAVSSWVARASVNRPRSRAVRRAAASMSSLSRVV